MASIFISFIHLKCFLGQYGNAFFVHGRHFNCSTSNCFVCFAALNAALPQMETVLPQIEIVIFSKAVAKCMISESYEITNFDWLIRYAIC